MTLGGRLYPTCPRLYCQTANDSTQPLSDTRAGRLSSLLFLGFAALCVIVPLLQTIHRIVPTIVPLVDEHRLPAPFPKLSLLLGANRDFAKDLNTWFDNRVGFRDLFIRAKNQIDYSLFQTSRKVFTGKDAAASKGLRACRRST